MTPSLFKRYWSERYACLPIGHHLRQSYESRWFRIHTLPESKRYAETESEYDEILRRYNAVLSDLLEEGQSYVLVTMSWSDSSEVAALQPEIETIIGTSEFLFNAQPEDDDDAAYAHFFMSKRVWKAGSLDQLLRMVADDETESVLIVNTEQDRIYHPYDGGADVILAASDEVAAKKQQYANWLSKHPLGL